MWKNAKPAQREQIDAALARLLDEAAATSDVKKALRQFISAFGEHALADRARQMLVEKLSGSDTMLERERLLRHLEGSSNQSVSTAAMAALAALLEKAEHPEAALAEYKRLESQVGDKPVIDRKSVKQMLAGLPADSPLAKAMAPASKWH